MASVSGRQFGKRFGFAIHTPFVVGDRQFTQQHMMDAVKSAIALVRSLRGDVLANPGFVDSSTIDLAIEAATFVQTTSDDQNLKNELATLNQLLRETRQRLADVERNSE